MAQESTLERIKHHREIKIGRLLAKAAIEAERLENRVCQALIEAALYGVMAELHLEELEVWPFGIDE